MIGEPDGVEVCVLGQCCQCENVLRRCQRSVGADDIFAYEAQAREISQRAATEGEKLESMAQLLEQESRHKSQIAAELRAYKEHVAEIEALLEID